jgi:ankyrin repeat protein
VSALATAASSGNLEIMAMLVENGANVDDTEVEIQNAPIVLAAKYGKIDALEYLLKNENVSNITKTSIFFSIANTSSDPMMLESGSFDNRERSDIVKLLAEKGIDDETMKIDQASFSKLKDNHQTSLFSTINKIRVILGKEPHLSTSDCVKEETLEQGTELDTETPSLEIKPKSVLQKFRGLFAKNNSQGKT